MTPRSNPPTPCPTPSPASPTSSVKPTAREHAADAVLNFVENRDLPAPIQVDVDRLSPRDAALATAIYRTAIQRFLTLEYFLNRFLKQPLDNLEPAMQAVLITGAAQLVAMQRLPRHAVVDESVKLARVMVRPQAAGMTNAVLRRVAELIATDSSLDQTWSPARNTLPHDDGKRVISLTSQVLPDPKLDPIGHLAIACSVPVAVLNRWNTAHGLQTTTAIAAHAVMTPPTIVYDEDGAHRSWTDDNVSLRAYLKENATRRVQDPTAADAVSATASLSPPPKLIMDYCAGRGTKSRQLARLFPDATVYAYDSNDALLKGLKDDPRVTTDLKSGELDPIDLLVLDVPCSNSGVIARRCEARYRMSSVSLDNLRDLQRRIARDAMPLLSDLGHVLYATCSIEPEENQTQVAWLKKKFGLTLIKDKTTLPSKPDDPYHDGGYFALLKNQSR